MTDRPIISEVQVLLDRMEALFSEARRLPWTRRVMVDAEDVRTLLSQLTHVFPEEMRQAHWVIKERDRIIAEAGHEADVILEEARRRAESLLGQSEVIRAAEGRVDAMVSEARERVQDMHAGAKAYADDVLASLETHLSRLVETVRENRGELKG